MPAVDYARRTSAFVAKWGSDDAGLNVVGAPQARLTIAQALADIATAYDAATPAAPKIIAMEPGTYVTPAFQWPPNVFIEADPDAQSGSNAEVIILLTGNITLAATWSINTAAVGGMRGLTIRQETSAAIDLTMPPPLSGNPARTFTIEDVRTNVDSLSYEATSTADVLQVTKVTQDGNTGDTVEFSGGAQTIVGLQSAAPVLFNDTATIAAAINANSIYTIAAPGATTPGVTFASSTGGLTARMGFCDNRALTLNRAGAAAITVYADAVSIPLAANLTFAGTAVNADLVRTTDGGGTSGGSTTGNGTANNAAGNTTITPDSRVYSYTVTVTVDDATTRIMILSTAGAPAPAAGDLLMVNIVSTGLTLPTIEFRNATAGGT
ncbi:MAG: hypothetical protein ACRED3_16100, partial [Bradyrhizobium sp.]